MTRNMNSLPSSMILPELFDPMLIIRDEATKLPLLPDVTFR